MRCGASSLRRFLILLGWCLSAPAWAGDGVALVLSGGGARGVAHLGVLKVMEELRIPVDCVVGTSMGSIVGGSFAAGVPLDELERKVRAARWDAIFANTTPRDEQPFREKQDAVHGRSAIEMGYGSGRVLMPQSAIAGQSLDRFLQDLVGAPDVLDTFDTLALPFRAVATDLVNGARVELDSGPLWRAMRASMAVPGVFLPIEQDGRLLADGGLVMNLPVAAGRALCGDRIIAIDVGTPPLPRERLRTASDIVMQAINLALERNVAEQRALIEPQDLLLEVDLGDIRSLDFDRVLETIPLGERAARAAAAQLARYSVDAATYAKWKRQREGRWVLPAPIIRDVHISELRYVEPESIEAQLDAFKGKPFERDRLERKLAGIYSGGDFERLRYSLVRDGPDADLDIEAVEKSWGPTYLRFGAGLTADFDGGGVVGLYGGVSRRWLNRWGARLDVDVLLGTNNRFRAELYQPLGLNANWFVAPSLETGVRAVPVYVEGAKLAEYKVRERAVGLDLGYELGAWGELRAGLRRGSLHASVLTGLPQYPEVNLEDGWLLASAILDRLDSPFFPRRGYSARLEVQHHARRFGGELDYTAVGLDALSAFSRDEHSVRIGVKFAGSPDRDLPSAARTPVGGPLELSGYRYGELSADQVTLVHGAYYRRVSKLPDSLGRGVYLGGSYEWADLRSHAANTDDGQFRSVSLFAGADTVLGPLYLGAGYAPGTGRVRYYLLLGQPY